jgi:cell division protein FtsN
MEIKIILFIVAMIFIIMILYKKSNPEQKQTMTKEVRPSNVHNREIKQEQQTTIVPAKINEDYSFQESPKRDTISIPHRQHMYQTPPSSGFANGLFSFFKFVLLIAAIFAAFGGGFYFGVDFENNRLAKETEERINRMESEKQRALNEMDSKYNNSIEQYKEQVRKTQKLLQEMQFRYNYGYDGYNGGDGY